MKQHVHHEQNIHTFFSYTDLHELFSPKITKSSTSVVIPTPLWKGKKNFTMKLLNHVGLCGLCNKKGKAPFGEDNPDDDCENKERIGKYFFIGMNLNSFIFAWERMTNDSPSVKRLQIWEMKVSHSDLWKCSIWFAGLFFVIWKPSPPCKMKMLMSITCKWLTGKCQKYNKRLPESKNSC